MFQLQFSNFWIFSIPPPPPFHQILGYFSNFRRLSGLIITYRNGELLSKPENVIKLQHTLNKLTLSFSHPDYTSIEEILSKPTSDAKFSNLHEMLSEIKYKQQLLEVSLGQLSATDSTDEWKPISTPIGKISHPALIILSFTYQILNSLYTTAWTILFVVIAYQYFCPRRTAAENNT